MKFGRKTSQSIRTRQRQSESEESTQKTSSFSYRSRRSQENLNVGRKLNQDASLKKYRSSQFWLQRAGLIILLLAVVVSGVNVLELSSTAEVLPATNNFASSQLFDKPAYQAAADRLLAESVWNHNKITVDTDKISRKLLSEFPSLASVSMTIPILAHHPIVYITPAEPVLIIQSATSGSFALDSNGKALLENTKNPVAIEQPILPVLTDLSGLKLGLGNQVLSTSEVSFVQIVSAQLKAKGYNVATMTLPPSASELDVKLAGQSYSIKFNLQINDPRQQVGTFLATIKYLQSQKITPSQYIDVRVDGRAYYQ